jgi:hypothetical protein
MLNIAFRAGAVEAGAKLRYGSTKMMRPLAAPAPQYCKQILTARLGRIYLTLFFCLVSEEEATDEAKYHQHLKQVLQY